MTTKTNTIKEFYIKVDGKQTRINKYGGELIDLIDELGWDYQCMTCGGRETYDKIQQLLGTLQEGEIYMEI
tara:strand:+ start:339 stop:551 length:213 start_codon:yes stop_codon:yes gene_type:complete